MTGPQKYNATPPSGSADTAAACNIALAETCKALKALSFYPQSHPLRAKLLNGAYQAITDLVKGGPVSLIVQRDGFSFADREIALAITPMTAALAQELFTRELQGLTLQPDLSPQDFTTFLSLLATDPAKLNAGGGFAALLAQQGIRSIAVNEIDISAVFTKRKAGQLGEEAAAQESPVAQQGEAGEPGSEWTPPGDFDPPPSDDLTVEELLARLAKETDDDPFRQLTRMLLAKAQAYKGRGDYDSLYPILAAMATRRADPGSTQVQRDCTLLVLQQLLSGNVTEHLLDHLQDEEFREKEMVQRIVAEAGAEVVDPVIARLIASGSTQSRNRLMALLARIGAPAVPALAALLRADKGQVVYTAVAALGEIGSKEAVKPLSMTLLHFDKRIRMESVRALARIGGIEATALLVDLIREGDQAAAVQAIIWLGNTRNHRALQPLLQLVAKRDLRGKSHTLKKEALHAMGRIGDRRALDPLFKLVNSRHLIGLERWRELKCAALEAISAIGGEAAQKFLEQVSSRGGGLREVSAAALATMAQKKATSHE